MTRGWLALVVCAGCGRGGSVTQPPPAAGDAPAAIHSEDAMTPSLLHPVVLSDLGLAAALPDGDRRDDVADGIRSARIVSGPVRVALSRGPATLDQFRATVPGDVAFEAETDATLCGQPARQIVARITPAYGEGARAGPDGALQLEPGGGTPTTFVARATQVGDEWVRAVWIVATDARDRHRADEDRFFAGVRCTP